MADRLAAYSKARTARRALESLDGVTVAQGGTPCPEVIVIFDVSLIDVVAAIVGSKRPRKRLTPEQRAALVERGRGFRFPSTKTGQTRARGCQIRRTGPLGSRGSSRQRPTSEPTKPRGFARSPSRGTMTTVVEALLMTVSEMELMTAPAMAPDDHPFDRVVAALRARGMTILPQRDGNIRATCPAHPDQKPSLIVTRRDDKVLMHCFAGCRKGAPAQALGFAQRTCSPAPAQPSGARRSKASTTTAIATGCSSRRKCDPSERSFGGGIRTLQRVAGFAWASRVVFQVCIAYRN